jgi:hypothetical protein
MIRKQNIYIFSTSYKQWRKILAPIYHILIMYDKTLWSQCNQNLFENEILYPQGCRAMEHIVK